MGLVGLLLLAACYASGFLLIWLADSTRPTRLRRYIASRRNHGVRVGFDQPPDIEHETGVGRRALGIVGTTILVVAMIATVLFAIAVMASLPRHYYPWPGSLRRRHDLRPLRAVLVTDRARITG
jgi:hypothetical protein